MITFEVQDMSCGHCVSAITEAVRGVDKEARLDIDLETHRVRIETADSSAKSTVEALRAAIAEAGYTPVAVRVFGLR